MTEPLCLHVWIIYILLICSPITVCCWLALKSKTAIQILRPFKFAPSKLAMCQFFKFMFNHFSSSLSYTLQIDTFTDISRAIDKLFTLFSAYLLQSSKCNKSKRSKYLVYIYNIIIIIIIYIYSVLLPPTPYPQPMYEGGGG